MATNKARKIDIKSFFFPNKKTKVNNTNNNNIAPILNAGCDGDSGDTTKPHSQEAENSNSNKNVPFANHALELETKNENLIVRSTYLLQDFYDLEKYYKDVLETLTVKTLQTLNNEVGIKSTRKLDSKTNYVDALVKYFGGTNVNHFILKVAKLRKHLRYILQGFSRTAKIIDFTDQWIKSIGIKPRLTYCSSTITHQNTSSSSPSLLEYDSNYYTLLYELCPGRRIMDRPCHRKANSLELTKLAPYHHMLGRHNEKYGLGLVFNADQRDSKGNLSSANDENANNATVVRYLRPTEKQWLDTNDIDDYCGDDSEDDHPDAYQLFEEDRDNNTRTELFMDPTRASSGTMIYCTWLNESSNRETTVRGIWCELVSSHMVSHRHVFVMRTTRDIVFPRYRERKYDRPDHPSKTDYLLIQKYTAFVMEPSLQIAQIDRIDPAIDDDEHEEVMQSKIEEYVEPEMRLVQAYDGVGLDNIVIRGHWKAYPDILQCSGLPGELVEIVVCYSV